MDVVWSSKTITMSVIFWISSSVNDSALALIIKVELVLRIDSQEL